MARKLRRKSASKKQSSDFNFGANKRANKPAAKTPQHKSANKPATKSATKSAPAKASKKGAVTPKRFVASKATRAEKFKQAKKIGKEAYHRRIMEWWEDHPDADPDENPYCYHGSDK